MSRQSGLSLNARRTLRPTRAAAGGDPYGDSPFMRSEVSRCTKILSREATSELCAFLQVVQKEAADIYKDFSLLSQMQPKYLSFDTEGAVPPPLPHVVHPCPRPVLVKHYPNTAKATHPPSFFIVWFTAQTREAPLYRALGRLR